MLQLNYRKYFCFLDCLVQVCSYDIQAVGWRQALNRLMMKSNWNIGRTYSVHSHYLCLYDCTTVRCPFFVSSTFINNFTNSVRHSHWLTQKMHGNTSAKIEIPVSCLTERAITDKDLSMTECNCFFFFSFSMFLYFFSHFYRLNSFFFTIIFFHNKMVRFSKIKSRINCNYWFI